MKLPASVVVDTDTDSCLICIDILALPAYVSHIKEDRGTWLRASMRCHTKYSHLQQKNACEAALDDRSTKT